MPTVHLLDYVAGNIRSLVNAINQVGYDVEWVKSPEDVKNADVSQRPRTNSTTVGSGLCHSNHGILETDTPRRWPFWPLSLPTGERRILGAYSTAHRSREAFYGDLCWSASPFPGLRGGQ